MKQILIGFFLMGKFLSIPILFIVPNSGFSWQEKPDLEKGRNLFEIGDINRGITSCASCHGPGGNSILAGNPNLSDQSYEYLLKQLIEFKIRDGEEKPIRLGSDKELTIMTALVQPLSLSDMQDISLYLSYQKLNDPAFSSKKEMFELGQKIWRSGIPDQRIPACAACHSANGIGIPGQYPRLSGQFANYIEEQLKLFRSETRHNEQMCSISKRMTDEDIKSVSDYAAGLR